MGEEGKIDIQDKKIGREMDIQYTKFESEMNILNTKIGSKIDIQYTHDSVLAGIISYTVC